MFAVAKRFLRNDNKLLPDAEAAGDFVEDSLVDVLARHLPDGVERGADHVVPLLNVALDRLRQQPACGTRHDTMVYSL